VQASAGTSVDKLRRLENANGVIAGARVRGATAEAIKAALRGRSNGAGSVASSQRRG